MTINFAYQSFIWNNNAKGNAAVIVVIIGLSSNSLSNDNKHLFTGSSYKQVNNISPYLTSSKSNVIVDKSKKSLFNLPTMYRGNMPTDGGGLILNKEDLNKVTKEVKPFIHKFVGSKDSLNGNERFVLWLTKSEYEKVKRDSLIQERISIVTKMRLASKKKSTNKLASCPWRFEFISQPCNYSGNTLLIPRVSSQNRPYMPISVLTSDEIVSDTATAIYNAPLYLFGLLESAMHMTWMKNIGGRLKNDYRYSSDLVYNTFPVPELSTRRKNEIEDLVWKILDIRDEEGGTLAELYGSPLAAKNPKPMNSRLKAAHEELDQVVDRAYRDRPFKDDNERLALLLEMYSQKVNEEK